MTLLDYALIFALVLAIVQLIRDYRYIGECRKLMVQAANSMHNSRRLIISLSQTRDPKGRFVKKEK